MPPNAQQQTEPVSFAPRRREITAVHEAGHAVAGHLLFGGISGARSLSKSETASSRSRAPRIS